MTQPTTQQHRSPPLAEHPSTRRNRRGRRLALGATTAAVIASGLGVVLLSPLLLSRLDTVSGVNWTRLSEIGQTYGAASAILAMLALGGVALSLLLQARQARADQIQAIRGFHTELVRMELDDVALYLPCWGPLDISTDDGKRQHIYTTLMMDYAWMGYEIGSIPEPWLRDMLAGMFQGEVGRRYWTMARRSWTQAAGGRRGRSFLRIVDEEHDKAVAAGPPALSAAPADLSPNISATTCDRHRWHSPAAAVLGVAGGLLLARALDRKKPC